MKTQKQDLASVFNQIERAAGALEEVAKGILAAIKANNAATIEQFNAMVSEAYGQNGWSQKAGRPAAGSKDVPAPRAVKFYVSRVRLAYRNELDVQSFETIGALLAALGEDGATSHQAAERPPELRGVQISSENSLNGALFHDVAVLWAHLPQEKKEMFEAQIRRLLKQYAKSAPPDLVKAI